MLRNLKLILSIFFYIVYTISLSQSDLEFYLIDENKIPIAYANIFSKSAQSGAYSNLEGRVILAKVKNSDTVEISCIGYETIELMVSEISDTISLPFVVKELDEFVIKSEYKNEEIGVLRKNFLRSSLEGNYAGFIKGIVFPEVQKSFLSEVSLYIEQPEDSSRTKFLLLIYDVTDSNYFPSKPLLTRKLFFDVSKEGWSTINLDSLYLKVEGKLFIGVETVPNYEFEDAPKFYEFSQKPCARYRFISYFVNKPLVSVYGFSGVQYFHPGITPYGNGSNNNFPLIKATIKY